MNENQSKTVWVVIENNPVNESGVPTTIVGIYKTKAEAALVCYECTEDQGDDVFEYFIEEVANYTA